MKKTLVLTAMLLSIFIAFPACSDAPAELARGVWDGNVYTSGSAGLTFGMPDNWEHATDEEISAIMGIDPENIPQAGQTFSKEMLELEIVYDLVAQDMQTSTNIILMYENLTFAANGTKTTAAQHLNTLEKLFSDIGYQFEGPYEEVLAGQTYQVLALTGENPELNQYYYMRKIGNDMLTIVISVDEKDAISQVVKYFS